MRIAIGADHGGYELKTALVAWMTRNGIEALDKGTSAAESCDYPVYGSAVANAVANGEADLGVVICKSGIGMSITANKVRGVRAALCHDEADAVSARAHNHANVLALSAVKTSADAAVSILKAFVVTQFEGGRHGRRVDQISELENGD